MNLNLQDILGYILPLVQDQKKDDAKKMLTKTLEPEKRSLLSSVVGALGMKQNPLELANLSSVLPSLLAMIKPEHIAAAQKFFTDLIQGKTPKTDAPAAKKTATKTSSAAAAPAAKKATASASAKAAAPAAKKTAASASSKAAAPVKKVTRTTAAKKK